MENRDIILVVSAIVVVVGWFVNSLLTRKHEVSKARAEYRIKTLKNYISFYIKAQNTKSLEGFNEIQVEFLLYGYADEIALIDKIARIVTSTPKNPEFLNVMLELNILVRNRLRVELGLPKIISQENT